MNADAKEAAFQKDIIDQMVECGWKRGYANKYDRNLALYTEDCLQYVKTTQPKAWGEVQGALPVRSRAGFHRQTRLANFQSRPTSQRQIASHVRHAGRTKARTS